MTLRLALILLGCASCIGRAIPLGQSAKDRARLSDAPALRHEAEALKNGEELAVQDLFRGRTTFVARPTPTALLQAETAANPVAAVDASHLTFVTYNVALLDIKGLGVALSRSPDIDARRLTIADQILERGYDLVALQEVWLAEDLARFAAAANRHGYWLAHSPRDGYTDGLALLVKKGFAPAPLAITHRPYPSIQEFEFFPGPAISRGFMSVTLEHPTLGEVVIYNTHMTPFPDAHAPRNEEARELGLHVERYTDAQRQLVIVAGDMNAGPYYRSDAWVLPNGQTQTMWFANTLSYPLLLHYGDLSDAVLRGRAPSDATLDITQGDDVPNEPALATRVPGGQADYCSRTPATNFTGTDCNPSYFAQYAGTEFPARLDHVLVRDPSGRVHVARSELVFTELLTLGARQAPLSDHFGVLVTMDVAKPQR